MFQNHFTVFISKKQNFCLELFFLINVSHRPLLKELKAASQFQILVDSEIHTALQLLAQSYEVKDMLGEYSNYVLTSLVGHSTFKELENRIIVLL